MRSYIQRSILTILRIFITYKPLRFFTIAGLFPFLLGALLGCRWLWYFIIEDSDKARVPSLILAAVLILIGVQLWIFGIVADVIAVNRKLLEDLQVRIKRIEFR